MQGFFKYLIIGFFTPYIIIITVKVFIQRKDKEFFSIISLFGIIIYFFFIKVNSHSVFKLFLFEFFILGIILYFENKQNKILTPTLIIFSIAIISEIVLQRNLIIAFYHYDIFLKILIGFTGYSSIAIGNRR